ncbi:hypothetical protein [Chryseobacterium sp. SIMBA_029]|uniref:hypothetical protein n=1 Tax=Chryseobacterium sp. SIMBA_029 TaxID=3085772 RepID=UPI00397DA0E8
MPKNENGTIECLNDKNHKMIKGESSYMVPSFKKPDNVGEPLLLEVTKGFAYDIHYCEECGYMELYDYKDEDE